MKYRHFPCSHIPISRRVDFFSGLGGIRAMTTKTLLGRAAFKSGRFRNAQGWRGASTFWVQVLHCARSILARCPDGLGCPDAIKRRSELPQLTISCCFQYCVGWGQRERKTIACRSKLVGCVCRGKSYHGVSPSLQTFLVAPSQSLFVY